MSMDFSFTLDIFYNIFFQFMLNNWGGGNTSTSYERLWLLEVPLFININVSTPALFCVVTAIWEIIISTLHIFKLKVLIMFTVKLQKLF